jgi:hypothetical protein
MSKYEITLTRLVTGLIEAVLQDEKPEEDGFDLSAGLFGTYVSSWIREVAKELEEHQSKIDALEYSLQLDEELLGLIQQVVSRLSSRPS